MSRYPSVQSDTEHFRRCLSLAENPAGFRCFRCSFGGHFALVRWHTFRQSISEAIKITPDAYFEIATGESTRAALLEVDLGTEALKVWHQKTAYYLQFAVSGEFIKRFRQQQFRVLVIANSDRRVANIRATVAKSTDKVFWFSTLDNIHRDGLWSPIWLRPKGDQRHSLL